MPLAIPQPESVYRGNYASLPAATLKPPIEQNRTVPVEILWLRDGQSPRYTIHFNARSQQTLAISQIAAVHVDNSQCGSSMHIAFPDTQFEVIVGANQVGFYPIVTNSLEFWAWIDTTPLAQDKTIIQVLNFLPPPILFSTSIGGSSVGTVREVDTAAPIQGGPITDTGTISLAVPLAVNFGGTAGTTGNAALDNLSGASGSASGTLSRSSGGVWSVSAALSTPFPVSSGGTGQVTLANNQLLVGSGTAPVHASIASDNGGTLSVAGALNAQATTLNSATVTTTLTVNGAATLAAGVNITGSANVSNNVSVAGGEVIGTAMTVQPHALIINDTATQPQAGIVGSGSLTVASEAQIRFTLDAYGPNPPFEIYRRARGTAAAPTVIQNADNLGVLTWQGWNGSGYAGGTAISASATEAWTATANGTELQFTTVVAGGTSVANSLILNGNTATFSGSIAMVGTLGMGSGGFLAVDPSNWIGHLPSGNGGFFFQDGAGANFVEFVGTSHATLNVSGSWATFSDPRLKTDIAPYAAGLTEIELLEPITYRYNGEGPSEADPPEVTRYGLDAQATQAVMPEMVSEHNGYLTLENGPLIYALVNACKELAARVAALEGAR